MNLLAFGFAQLRRHLLLNFLWITVPFAIAMALTLALVLSQPLGTPEDIWRQMSWVGKLLTVVLLPCATWIPLVLGQTALAHVLKAEQNGESPDAARIVRRTLQSSLRTVPAFFFLALLWLLATTWFVLPGFFLACFIGYAPMVVAIQSPKRVLPESVDIAKNRFGDTVGIWLVAAILCGGVWAIPAYLWDPMRPSAFLALRLAIQVLVISVVEAVLNGALLKVYFEFVHAPQPSPHLAQVGH